MLLLGLVLLVLGWLLALPLLLWLGVVLLVVGCVLLLGARSGHGRYWY